MKAIILAGGKGTRFLPLTEKNPKALIEIGGKTLLQMAIEQLPSLIDTVIVTTKYLGETIKNNLGNLYDGRTIVYVSQPIDQDGTWPAFYAAKIHIRDGERFCVLGCDDFFKTKELERAIISNQVGMGVTETIMPAKYHGILIDKNNMIQGLQRHPNQDREELVRDCFANGFFILDSTVFDFEPVRLIDGEYGLPQTLLAHPEYPLYAHQMNYWRPCNTFGDLEKI